MLFEVAGDPVQLSIGLGHDPFQLGDRPGRADPGDHVFALRVDEELAVESVFPRCGVPCEADAGGGGLAQVPENHRLDIHGGTQIFRDSAHAPVVIGAGVEPRAEDGVPGHLELAVRVLGEWFIGLLLDQLLVISDDEFQVGSG